MQDTLFSSIIFSIWGIFVRRCVLDLSLDAPNLHVFCRLAVEENLQLKNGAELWDAMYEISSLRF